MTAYHDAIIIGAGPAGSCAAILLAQAGWSVALIEKQDFPRGKVCGACIAASNLPLLEALGIGEAFGTLSGPPLRHLAVMSGDHSIHAALPAAPHPVWQWGYALEREHLDLLLMQRAAAAGAAVFQPCVAEDVTGQAGAWRCRISAASRSAGSMTLSAPVLIVAAGSWGNHGGGRLHNPRASDLFAFKARFCNTSLAPGLLSVLALPGGYGGMVISGQGRATVACCIRRDRLALCRRQWKGRRAGESVECWLKACCAGLRNALQGATREHGWLAIGPIRTGIRINCGRPGAFLVGNAAGEAHPLIGEGISMALQSALLLCELLIRHGEAASTARAQHSVQQEYARRWHAMFGRRIRLAAVFAHLAMRPGLASGLLPLLKRHPALLTQAAMMSGKAQTFDCSNLTPRIIESSRRQCDDAVRFHLGCERIADDDI